MVTGRRLQREMALGLTICLAFASAALLSVALTRDTNSVAALWLANGVLAAGFLLLSPRGAIALGAACAAASLAINILTGAPSDIAPVFTALNITEALLAALLIRRLCGTRIRIGGLPQLVRIVLLAVAPAAAITAVLAACALAALGRPFTEVLSNWFLAHSLGMAITLPAVLLLADRRSGPDHERSPLVEAAVYGLVITVSFAAYLPWTFPAPLLITPTLVVAAFSLGPRGTALSAVIMAVICTIVLTLGPGGAISSMWSPASRIHNLQFVIATALFTSLSVALILAEQARTRRLLAMRTRAAKRAQARAQDAGAAKGEFLATMSHEIRTPMNAILGFTQTLRRRDDLPDEARRQLELVHRAGGSLLAVVNDILDYSRLETGEVELAPLAQTPLAVARDALDIIIPAAEAKGLDIILDQVGPTQSAVMIDDLRVRQVLLNLLSNAVKFTETGQVRLILTARDQGTEMLLRFEVQDTGVGIPRDRMHRLFRRFSQADSSVSRAFGGSGLGLAICKGLVEAMGGLIGVRSQPGSGSTFWFEFTAERAEVSADAPAPEDLVELGRAHVLLVDDHAMNRDLGATILDLLGCQVSLACDGAEALEMARSGAFDVILMDIHMPIMDGVEATQKIRALEGPASQVPIIAMSADVMPEMVERCRRAGMSDAVGKPVQIEALHAALNRWTSGPSAADQAGDIPAVA
ncbi:MAG: ATP-binding protein [Phenylobacterium sp.]|uniref:ATP-binding protein n=1 Tax=Phenylobacterium sp. TaxID=1871053 RepID=UPI0027195879|nr:ATP-binding protein [Phenylobacterium sp.]MDO8901473.1 ATP-binding protein [Phenylobacterium sp.]